MQPPSVQCRACSRGAWVYGLVEKFIQMTPSVDARSRSEPDEFGYFAGDRALTGWGCVVQLCFDDHALGVLEN